MIFDLATLTVIHTALSFVALATGTVVVAALLVSRRMPVWTNVFLATAAATSLTGFLFPFNGVLPSHVVGGVALLVLAAMMLVVRVRGWQRRARRLHALGLVASLYLLVFVGIAQAFAKVPFLRGLAPTQSELPFVLAQLLALVVAIGVGAAVGRSHHAAGVPAGAPG